MDFEHLKQLVGFEKYHFGSEKIWNEVSSSLKKELIESFRVLNYRKNQIVYQENAYPTGLYLLKKGKVKKYKHGLNGKPQIFYIASEGELLGYHPLLSNEYYPNTTETLESCEIGFIPQSIFKTLFESSSDFKEQIIKVMSHEYAVLINHITLMTQYNSRERLALLLLILKEKYKQEIDEPANIQLSREDLSNFVGTARENLIRLLNEFKKADIISTQGRIINVLKPEELVRISNMSLF